MMDMYQQIKSSKIIPVIVIDRAETAEGLGRTLLEANLPIAEITLRTTAGLESIRIMSTAFSEILVGAGTVLTVQDLQTAVAIGASFAVSPCLDYEVIEEAQKLGIPFFPGVANPTQVWEANKLGLRTVKVFPAEASGGISMIKAMASVFPEMHYMPTGGINASNASKYLNQPSVLAVGGSWIVERDQIDAENWPAIKKNIAEIKENL